MADALRCDECHETNTHTYGWLKIKAPPQVFNHPEHGDFCSWACAHAWVSRQVENGADQRTSDNLDRYHPRRKLIGWKHYTVE